MRIGIITMISDNYGNRLQNYALQEALIKIGNTVETLNNPWEDDYNKHKELIKQNIKKLFYILFRIPLRYKRKIKFDKFNNENIIFSNLWLNQEKDRRKANEYFDLFVCGSDQVWNSEAKEINGKYFAAFADENKRISYAASFGIESIMEERKEEFTNYLKGMKYISVREQSGIKIVEELTGNKAYCHIDPTLLLNASEWDAIATECPTNKERYIFCYFLGKPSQRILREIEKYKEKNKIKVYSISSEYDATHNNVGPEEFIALIRDAEFVLTDSFHGTVFSIIYQKPFYSFSRNGVKESMDTRILSLLDLSGLEDRFEPQMLDLEKIYKINFNDSKISLEKERKKAMKYLKMVSNVDDN